LFSPTATYSGSINITSGSVGDTVLSDAQLASHVHLSNFDADNPGTSFPTAGGAGGRGAPYPRTPTNVGSTGGNATHTHSLVGAAAGGNFTSDFSVKYANFIICSKN
jgi:hypothetical protein